MLARIHKAMEEREEGFTLIELLVVMIIIGILAGIAIPVFLRQREKAYDSQTRSDVRNAATAEESYFTDNNNYTTSLSSLQTDDGWKTSGHDVFQVVGLVDATGAPSTTDTQSGYEVAALSSSGTVWCYNSVNSGNGVYKGATGVSTSTTSLTFGSGGTSGC